MGLLARAGANVFEAAAGTFKTMSESALDRERQAANLEREKHLAKYRQGLMDESSKASFERESGQRLKELEIGQTNELEQIDERALQEEIGRKQEHGLLTEREKASQGYQTDRMREEQGMISARSAADRQALKELNSPEMKYRLQAATTQAQKDVELQGELDALQKQIELTYDPKKTDLPKEEYVRVNVANQIEQKLKKSISAEVKSKLIIDAGKAFDDLAIDNKNSYDILVAENGGDVEQAKTKYVMTQYAVAAPLLADGSGLITGDNKGSKLDNLKNDILSSEDPAKTLEEFKKAAEAEGKPKLLEFLNTITIPDSTTTAVEEKEKGPGLLEKSLKRLININVPTLKAIGK